MRGCFATSARTCDRVDGYRGLTGLQGPRASKRHTEHNDQQGEPCTNSKFYSGVEESYLFKRKRHQSFINRNTYRNGVSIEHLTE